MNYLDKQKQSVYSFGPFINLMKDKAKAIGVLVASAAATGALAYCHPPTERNGYNNLCTVKSAACGQGPTDQFDFYQKNER